MAFKPRPDTCPWLSLLKAAAPIIADEADASVAETTAAEATYAHKEDYSAEAIAKLK